MTSVGDRAAEDLPAGDDVRTAGVAEPDPRWMGPLRVRERPRRIVVVALAEGVGTTTVALLTATLAAEQPGRVAALDATPYADGLAARLLSPPGAGTERSLADRLAVRAIDTEVTSSAVDAAIGDEDV